MLGGRRKRRKRKPRLAVAQAELARGIFHRAGIRFHEQRVMQRHQPVLDLERALEIAAEAGELELRAERGRDIGGDRDAALAAMRHEAERGRVLARELDEVLAERRALLAHARHVGGRVLHADDVLRA